jgi:M6 family metalloprotease-like protein
LRAREAPLSRPIEPGATASHVLRATGNVHVLVILAEFSDLPARIAPSRFQDLLFGPERSMRAYYDECSDGQLDLTGEIRGWVTLPGRQFDYSDGVRGTGPYPRNAQKMTEDAVQAAVASGLDLAGFDADGDGVVDALLVIHSGQGFEWAGMPGASTQVDPNSINSHKWVTVQRDFGAGKPIVTDYFTCPELMLVKQQFAPQWSDSIATIGVYCHEFGHILGLPDFYDTSTFENHVGVWEVMDYGTWNQIPPDPLWSAPGSIPSHFSAWSKMFLGWTDPILIAPGVGEELSRTETLESASRGGAPAQLLGNPFGVDWQSGSPGLGEFFLAEVRTLDGFDAGLPAAGLLLYHVDETRATNSAQTNAGPGRILRLLAQDGSTSFDPTESVEDPWGWVGAQATFDATSTPSSALWDSSSSGVALENITMNPDSSNPDSSVSFRANVSNLTSTVRIPFARPNPWQPSAHGDLRLVVSLSPGGSAFTEVALHDVRGARVRVLDATEELDAQNRVAVWDGRNEAGRPMPAGVYFFRARTSSGESRGGKVMLLR